MIKSLIFFFLFFISCSDVKSQNNDDLPESKIVEIKNFLKDKNYNQDIAVFINFKVHSGKYRYFVYDLRNNKIVQKAIVSHGSGSVVAKSADLQFSNIENSYQSSLGKYEIRESYDGKFGKAYRLNGLDFSNNNARLRNIVLHSYHCIPNQESDDLSCLSLGCPMLSQKAFNQTAKYLDQSPNPVILYAFY